MINGDNFPWYDVLDYRFDRLTRENTVVKFLMENKMKFRNVLIISCRDLRIFVPDQAEPQIPKMDLFESTFEPLTQLASHFRNTLGG
jgi:hypothetical protein